MCIRHYHESCSSLKSQTALMWNLFPKRVSIPPVSGCTMGPWWHGECETGLWPLWLTWVSSSAAWATDGVSWASYCLVVVVCLSWLVLASEDSMLNIQGLQPVVKPLVAWCQPWWKYFHHGNWQMVQIRDFFPHIDGLPVSASPHCLAVRDDLRRWI